MRKFKDLSSKEKQNIYLKLGASYWQKFVFKVEDLKYKIIKLIPNYKEKLDKLYDLKYNRLIKNAKTEEEKEAIKTTIRSERLLTRKELVNEENRNYHFDELHPENFINYLNFNKNVHLRGIGSNVGALAALGIGSIFVPTNIIPYIIGLSAFEVLSLYVNFECVNLQNYNLERFTDERLMSALKKKSEKKIEKKAEEYKNASKKIARVLENSSSIPNINDIVSSLDTKEEKEEFARMLIEQRNKVREKRR